MRTYILLLIIIAFLFIYCNCFTTRLHMTDKINVISDYNDGFGHQARDLLNMMALHGINNIYFDAPYLLNNKTYKFEHLENNDRQTKLATEYIQEVLKQFANDHGQIPYKYKKVLRTKQKVFSDKNLYQLGGGWPQSLPNYKQSDMQLFVNNLRKCSKYFRDNIKLPPNRLSENNIVIHVRMGGNDQRWYRPTLADFKDNLNQIVQKTIALYPNYKIYIHCDRKPKKLLDLLDSKNKSYTFYPESTPVLNVLSDLMNAKVLVIGDTSLSILAAIAGKHDLVVASYLDGYLPHIENHITSTELLRK